METSSNKRTATTIIILIATALLIGGVVFVSQQNKPKDDGATAAVSKTDNKKSSLTKAASNTAAGYKAGSYSASGDYQSPGGSQEIKIRLTLNSDGTITDTSAEGDNKSSDSKFYQSSFIANYKNKVVGKNIDEVKLDRVGASSLTSGGFQNALEDIRNQAKA